MTVPHPPHRGEAGEAAARPRTRATRCPRLTALLDDGHRSSSSAPDDDSGMLAAVGTVDGTRSVAFCSDADRHGRRDGRRGLPGRRRRLPPRDHRPRPDHRSLALRRCPPRRGRALPARGRPDLPRDDPGLAARSRRSPSSSAPPPAAPPTAPPHRRRDPRPRGPHLRDRPDVVRSVTGEDVDMLRLGGPEPHGRRSGVVHILTESEREALQRARTLAVLLGSQGSLARRRPSRTATSRTHLPEIHQARLRRAPAARATPRRRHHASSCTRAGRPTSSPRSVASAAAPSASSPTTRSASAAASTPSPPRRPPGSCACATRSGARSIVVVDVPGYLPGRRPGVGRRRTPRRQAAARLRRVRRPPGHPGDPQDLRRRLHRHELPLPRRDQGLRLARRRGRRHGRARRRPHPPPAQARRGLRRPPSAGRGRARRRARADRRRRRQGRRDRCRRRGRRAVRHPRQPSPRAIADAVQTDGVRRGQHGNIPL